MKHNLSVQLWEVTPPLTLSSLEGSKVLENNRDFLTSHILQRDFAVKLPLIQKLILAMSLKWQLKSILCFKNTRKAKYGKKVFCYNVENLFVLLNFN